MRVPMRLVWVPAVGVLLVGVVVLGAQSAKPSVDTSMTELVGEVRGLRQTVDRTANLAARTQIALGRVQFEENRLAELRGRLDETRQRIRTSTSPPAIAELRLQEQTLVASLNDEQRRFSEYNARLEALERELARGAAGTREP
jgi:predicted  nucleic acid-binding Zn-ribbon protein